MNAGRISLYCREGLGGGCRGPPPPLRWDGFLMHLVFSTVLRGEQVTFTVTEWLISMTDYWITKGSCYLPLAGEKSSAIRNLLANPPFGVIWKVTHKRERYARVEAKTPFWVHRFLFTRVHLPFEHPPQYTLFPPPPPPLLRVGIQEFRPATQATNKVKSASGRIVREDSRSWINA